MPKLTRSSTASQQPLDALKARSARSTANPPVSTLPSTQPSAHGTVVSTPPSSRYGRFPSTQSAEREPWPIPAKPAFNAFAPGYEDDFPRALPPPSSPPTRPATPTTPKTPDTPSAASLAHEQELRERCVASVSRRTARLAIEPAPPSPELSQPEELVAQATLEPSGSPASSKILRIRGAAAAAAAAAAQGVHDVQSKVLAEPHSKRMFEHALEQAHKDEQPALGLEASDGPAALEPTETHQGHEPEHLRLSSASVGRERSSSTCGGAAETTGRNPSRIGTAQRFPPLLAHSSSTTSGASTAVPPTSASPSPISSPPYSPSLSLALLDSDLDGDDATTAFLANSSTSAASPIPPLPVLPPTTRVDKATQTSSTPCTAAPEGEPTVDEGARDLATTARAPASPVAGAATPSPPSPAPEPPAAPGAYPGDEPEAGEAASPSKARPLAEGARALVGRLAHGAAGGRGGSAEAAGGESATKGDGRGEAIEGGEC